jgi:putative ABC transport system substrate-binding protein
MMKSKFKTKKSKFAFAAGVLFFTVAVSAHAQQQGKIFRIGFLDPSTASGGAVLLDSFRDEMRRLGWTEGKNFTIVYRSAEGQGIGRLPDLAVDLVRLKVDLIVTPDTPATVAAKNATTSIPIVMTNAGDPVGVGLVTSLARPGGNVTGLSSLGLELNTKRLEILKDAVPKLVRVGILRPALGTDRQVRDLKPAAAALNLQIDEIATKVDAQGLESALQAAKQKRAGAIMTTSATIFFAERKRIVEFASKYRLPAIYPQDEFVEAGGLMSYGADAVDLYRRAAVYVDNILKGAKAADLPVEQPTKFEMVINLKTAKQIGLTIPPNVLARADRVIK